MAEKSYIQRQREQSESAKRRRERSGDSRSNLEVRQDADQQRKFDRAVAAGVDPAVAARAFNVTREGTTDIVTIQSVEGVGVTARTNQGGRTRTAQEFFSRQEGSGSLGAEFAIPTDAAGRTPTDQMIRARSQPVPSSVAFGGPLRYAGPNTPTSRTAVATGSRIYPVDFPVFGAPQYDAPPINAVRAYSERGNVRWIPDFIETPARDIGRGFRDARREPGRFSERFAAQPGFYSVGATGGVVSSIAELAAIPTALSASRRVALGVSSRLGLSSTIIGGVGASVAAPAISSRLDLRSPSERMLLSDPRFQQSFEEAQASRRQSIGPVLGFVDSVPGFGPRVVDTITRGRSSTRFREAFGEAAIREGLPQSQIDIGVREFESRQRGGGFGLVAGQGPSEILGRATFAGSQLISRPGVRAFVSTAPAGFLEVATILGVEAEASRGSVRPRDLAIYGPLGAGIAGTTSALIVGNFARGQALRESADFILDPSLQSQVSRQSRDAIRRAEFFQTTMNVVDPAEIGGDAIADAIMRPRGMSPRVRTFDAGTVFTNVFDQSGVPSGRTTTDSRASFSFGRAPTPTSVRSPVVADFVGGVPTNPRSPVESMVPARGGRGVRTPNFENTFVPVNTRVNPFVPVSSRTQINPFVPVTVPTRTPVFPFTPLNTRTPVNPFSNIFTNTRTQVTPFVRTFTDFPIGAFNFAGSGGGRSGFGLEGSRKRNARNLPSLTAAFQSGFNPGKAEKSLRGRSFTGIEIRGFL